MDKETRDKILASGKTLEENFAAGPNAVSRKQSLPKSEKKVMADLKQYAAVYTQIALLLDEQVGSVPDWEEICALHTKKIMEFFK